MSITFKCEENGENELTFSKLDKYQFFSDEESIYDGVGIYYKLNDDKNDNCLFFDADSLAEISLYDFNKNAIVTPLKVDIELKFSKV